MSRLAQLLQDSPYQGYAYAYPHKTAYRRLPEPVPLRAAWAGERRDALFLYLHVPFCEMRCGFCNLFTQVRPGDDRADRFLAALEREAARARVALGDARFTRCAIGGGTPTFLTEPQLDRLVRVMRGMGPGDVPFGVETSPATAERGKLDLLRAAGASRVSIGVQSFDERETSAAARPQRRAEVERALATIRAAGIPTLNIDLIYGLPGQTVESWLESVRAALQFAPEELYLYPLYVRPLTSLGKSRRAWDDLRLACYREAVALLADAGYAQISMRMFRAGHAPTEGGPVYCCQDDGMVGLGCGARSYTRALHYSREFAVGARGVREIIAAYLTRTDAQFEAADHGFRLTPAEQRRRYVLQSLLQADGLDRAAYRRRFGSEVLDDLPELRELAEHGLAGIRAEGLRLTPEGLERSDTIGPWLYSEAVQALMREYELR